MPARSALPRSSAARSARSARRPAARRVAAGIAAAATLTGAALSAVPVQAGAAETPATGARAAAPTAPVSLWAPTKQVVWTYEGNAYTDLGIKLVAQGGSFELRSTRTSYDAPVRTVWRSPAGDIALPAGSSPTVGVLRRFVGLTFTPVDGGPARTVRRSSCLGGTAERVRPDAAATSPYPRSCFYNPYSLGSVQGVQDGWAASVLGYGSPLRLDPGRYDVVARVNPAYAAALGLSAEQAETRTRVVVKAEPTEEVEHGGGHSHARSEAGEPVPVRPADREPTQRSAGTTGPRPDLRSLPAWGIGVARNGNYLHFAATVWNGGDSPLVVDGFRSRGEQTMEGYQYFFDAAGQQTGYQHVGQLDWDAKDTHRHWHFQDFASYTLLRSDRSVAVRSRKEAFCLANTDAVDLTVPGADWDVEGDDLATACGEASSMSIREVLSAGWGDTYAQFRAGQSFNLKGLPNGTYWIAVVANPRGRLVETSTANNTSLRRVVIGGKPGARTVRVPQVGMVKEPVLMDEPMPGFRVRD